MMAIGAQNKCTVGDVVKLHETAVRLLIGELAAQAAIEMNVVFPIGIADRLLAYGLAVAHFPTALKEQEVSNVRYAY